MSLAAIVGGTASKLGGGKFANGAVSGAFVHMYNYTAHASEWLPKEGNRVERDYPILGKINNVSRGISKFFDVVSEAFSGLSNVPRAISGAYKGLSSMEGNINNIQNDKARMLGTAIYIKSQGASSALSLTSISGAQLIESEYKKE